MRISMLFNPKTQVRNVAGNALIMPVNSFSDLFSSYADKLIAKKTGVRTTGTTNVKAMLKGIKKEPMRLLMTIKKESIPKIWKAIDLKYQMVNHLVKRI